MMRYAGVISVVLLMFAQTVWAESEWRLDKEDGKRGIKVYTRSIEGSSLREFKGTMSLKSSLTAFIALLADGKRAPEWMHNCESFEFLKHVEPGVSYSYVVTGAPWPVKDRDAYVLSKVVQRDDMSIDVSLEARPEYGKETKKFVRIPFMSGSWKFVPAKDGLVDVTYQVHADPGGSLPNWLSNMVVLDTPYNTLRNMQKLVLESQYQTASLEYVQNMLSE